MRAAGVSAWRFIMPAAVTAFLFGVATIAVLEDAGYRTLNDIIDLEREDFLRLPGIAPEEADRIMAMLDELTEEGSGEEPASQPDEGTTV